MKEMLKTRNRKATKRPDGPIQVILPRIWCDNVGLGDGGSVGMEFDDEKLIIRPIKEDGHE